MHVMVHNSMIHHYITTIFLLCFEILEIEREIPFYFQVHLFVLNNLSTKKTMFAGKTTEKKLWKTMWWFLMQWFTNMLSLFLWFFLNTRTKRGNPVLFSSPSLCSDQFEYRQDCDWLINSWKKRWKTTWWFVTQWFTNM